MSSSPNLDDVLLDKVTDLLKTQLGGTATILSAAPSPVSPINNCPPLTSYDERPGTQELAPKPLGDLDITAKGTTLQIRLINAIYYPTQLPGCRLRYDKIVDITNSKKPVDMYHTNPDGTRKFDSLGQPMPMFYKNMPHENHGPLKPNTPAVDLTQTILDQVTELLKEELTAAPLPVPLPVPPVPPVPAPLPVGSVITSVEDMKQKFASLGTVYPAVVVSV